MGNHRQTLPLNQSPHLNLAHYENQNNNPKLHSSNTKFNTSLISQQNNKISRLKYKTRSNK
jgi:hypothetical protein